MDIDAIIASGIFLLFIFWSFSYFSLSFSNAIESNRVLSISDIIFDKIFKKISRSLFFIETSVMCENCTIVRILPIVPGYSLKNTTIFINGKKSECMYSNNSIFFLTTKENFNLSIFLGYGICNTTLDIINYSTIYLDSGRMERFIIKDDIEKLRNISYDNLKQFLDVVENFNISIECNNYITTLGESITTIRNVFSKTYFVKMYPEMNSTCKLYVRIW